MKRSPLSRAAACGALALAAAACSSSNSGNTNYAQFFKLTRQSLSAGFGKTRITREQAAAIPYASLGYTLDGGNQGLLVLATDSGGDLLWTSAAHVVIVTREGRIIRTVGLGKDLSNVTSRDQSGLPPVATAVRAPFSSTRLADFPDLGLYGVRVSCRTTLAGRQSVKILGQLIATLRVEEACTSRNPDWSFTDSFWVDKDNGFVWRSRQHVHPKGMLVETEIFRPPG
ncbi:MAG TPA: YjbF family lipoprotein [Rhizomicrobium sp.]|nr:YjbF family lipoprotein [Rhizomicrobium sp.]